MDLDDSKYILQLARADVLSLPPTPGDWNVHVKRPDPDSAPAGKDHDMGEHQRDDGASGSPGAAHLKTEDTDSQAHHTPAADNSPRAAKAPRIHSRDSTQDAAPRTWTAQHAVSNPERLRGHTSAARSPSSQRGQKYYRMALVSAIQPSFGTDPLSMNQADGAKRNGSAPQMEYDGGDYGEGETTPGQGSRS